MIIVPGSIVNMIGEPVHWPFNEHKNLPGGGLFIGNLNDVHGSL